MSCCVQPAGIDPGVGAADPIAEAIAEAAGVPTAADAAPVGLPDAAAATGLAGMVVQFACDVGAQAAIPATITPPPATAAPRRKPRRDTALSRGLSTCS